MTVAQAAVLFDMDGTLLHLGVDLRDVRRRLAERFIPFGVTAPFSPVLVRIRAAAREAAGRGGDEQALALDGLDILSRAEVAAARSARSPGGASVVLGELARRGVRLGLVTDNGRACVAPAFAAAGLDLALFTSVVTRDDVPDPKPSPAGILSAARVLGPARVLWMIGDHPRDAQAARIARSQLPGIRSALVTGGLADALALDAAGAEAILDELAAVLSLPGIPT